MAEKITSSDRKIFVLDTSVILFDHNAIFNFEENDVAIPISVLEELDQFKKGNDTLNFEAREFTRDLDNLAGRDRLADWIPLGDRAAGRLTVVMNEKSDPDTEELFSQQKADHRILNVAIRLTAEYPDRRVVLVTKDINLRLKAKSLNIFAEDYETGKIKDVSNLNRGAVHVTDLSSELIDKIYEQGWCLPEQVTKQAPHANQYFILRNGKNSVLAYYNPHTERIEKIDKRPAYGITPRNAEQTFALHAVMNMDVRLVTLMGVAGTGKTLLALAGSLEMRRHYRQIFLARPVVPLSNKDIGFLPGDIKDKLNPYMEPLWDNLKFIQSQFGERSSEFRKINDMVQNEKLLIQPLAYIRGRSLSNIIFIVDEAQNLTPHEVKTIITRAGEGTKIIFTGDIFQIDTPYLDSESNGLSYLVDRVSNHPLSAHVSLERGERSELANLANELL